MLSKFSGFSRERILFSNSVCVNMVMQIQFQIGDTRRVFFYESASKCFKKTTLCVIPKARFMDYDSGEYVGLNDVCMADIRLASLVYLRCLRLQVLGAYCTFASKQAVPITLFGPRPNNKLMPC